MSIVLKYFETGEGIDNPNTGVTWGWTGHDYVPYFDYDDLGEFFIDGPDAIRVLNQTTSYNLSGFQIGHEVSFALACIFNDSTTDTEYDVEWGIYIYRKISGESEELAFTYDYVTDIGPQFGTIAWAGTGIDIDEEWDNIEYMRYEVVLYGIAQDSITVTYSNVGTYSNNVVGLDDYGYIWVEGDNIAFTDHANEGPRYAKHLIRHDGNIYSTGKPPGYIRVDSNNNGKLGYIDANGNERKTYLARNYWNYTQLGTGRPPGYIWVSNGNSYGAGAPYSYINWIGYDGKQYAIINGTVSGYEGNLLP